MMEPPNPYLTLIETQLNRIEEKLDRALRDENHHRTRIYVWLALLSASLGGATLTHMVGVL